MNKDVKQLQEAFDLISEKRSLSAKQKKIAQAAPPPDEITGADFAALKKKKKLKDVKESTRFRDVWKHIMNEGISFSEVKKGHQYVVTFVDGTEKTLKGESVLMLDQNRVKSVEPAHKE